MPQWRHPRDRLNWWIRNTYWIAVLTAIGGGVVAGFSAMEYYGGSPERFAQSRTGSRHVPASPPGSPQARTWMWIGLCVIALGVLALGGTGLVHAVIRAGTRRLDPRARR